MLWHSGSDKYIIFERNKNNSDCVCGGWEDGEGGEYWLQKGVRKHPVKKLMFHVLIT